VRIDSTTLAAFLQAHSLPDAFRDIVEQHYLPLAEWLLAKNASRTPFFLGINGAQGTGKSILAEFLRLATAQNSDRKVVVLSLDDFYLDRDSRERLSRDVHPLLRVRGVPGTHDTDLLQDCLRRLRSLRHDESLRLPVFDKATDDRAASDSWPAVCGETDIVILEGWCVGTPPQADEELVNPVNALEAAEDSDRCWRRYVNDCLRERYAPIFAQLDALCFLQAPDFASVRKWRMEQEHKLAVKRRGKGVMSDASIVRFVQFYERLTNVALLELPAKADVLLRLDRRHGCDTSLYKNRYSPTT
jgi:D-glycerate 3-kinase